MGKIDVKAVRLTLPAPHDELEGGQTRGFRVALAHGHEGTVDGKSWQLSRQLNTPHHPRPAQEVNLHLLSRMCGVGQS
jgi:hypothetical protein